MEKGKDSNMSGLASGRRTLGFLLRDASRLMRRRFVHHAREAGLPLNRSEAGVLVQVWHEPGINLAGIATLMDLETITVVRLVDGLEATGLLERRLHPSDRRVRTLWLTGKGEQVVAQVLAINALVRAEALAGCPEADRERLLDLLQLIRSNLAGNGHSADSAAA
jgi:DNA-binding MarR family transcriptional regulator